jgi:hypothetical protein
MDIADMAIQVGGAREGQSFVLNFTDNQTINILSRSLQLTISKLQKKFYAGKVFLNSNLSI